MPLPSVVAVPIDDPSLIRLIVLLASAVPLIVGVVSLVVVVPVDIVGCAGAVLSTVILTVPDVADTLPAASVAVTLNKIPLPPSDDGVTTPLPLPSVVAVPIDDPSLIRLIVLLASAVPLIVGVVSLVVVVPVDIVGCAGFVVSTVILTVPDVADTLPAASVAVTVKE